MRWARGGARWPSLPCDEIDCKTETEKAAERNGETELSAPVWGGRESSAEMRKDVGLLEQWHDHNLRLHGVSGLLTAGSYVHDEHKHKHKRA